MLAKIKEDEGDIAGNYCLKTQYKYFFCIEKLFYGLFTMKFSNCLIAKSQFVYM